MRMIQAEKTPLRFKKKYKLGPAAFLFTKGGEEEISVTHTHKIDLLSIYIKVEKASPNFLKYFFCTKATKKSRLFSSQVIHGTTLIDLPI